MHYPQYYAEQGQKKIIIDGFPRSMENLEGWEKLVGDKVDVRLSRCLLGS